MILVLLSSGLRPRCGSATFLQLPHIGGRDGGLSGNVVATPEDPGSLLLINPAGVVAPRGTELSSAFNAATMSGRYRNPIIGYDQKSSEPGYGPVGWLGTDRFAPWYVGAGVFGSVGSSLNFAAQPSAGVPEQFLSESGLIQMGFVIGREVLPGLRAGAEVGPNWGRMRTRFPALGPFPSVHFDIDGFGVGGQVGLLYDLTEQTTLGISYRTPGIVYMGGSGAVGGAPEHVDINFHTPQSVMFGFAHHVTPKLLVATQAAWTDYPNFEKGVFEFEHNPLLNHRFISRARSVFRYGAGAEYALADWLWLRSGFSREEWMMEPSALSPLLYDTTDTMIMLGLGVAYQQWTFDASIGLAEMEDRLVTPEDQQAFPGRYQLEASPGFTMGVTYRFGSSS